MLNDTPGWIDARLAMVGTPEIPLYLIVNDEAATLIEGGQSGMTELVWQQLHALLRDHGGIRQLRYWLITRSHYDHSGLLLTLKSCMPWIHVSGSTDAFDSLQSPSAWRTIRQLDVLASRAWVPLVDIDFTELSELPFYHVNPDRKLEIGDEMQIRTFVLPGRSRCQFGYCYPQLDVAFMSDEIGEFHDSTEWSPLVFHDRLSYWHSLDVVEQLGASRLALGRHGVLTGDLIRLVVRHVRASLDAFEIKARAICRNADAAQVLAHDWTTRYAARSASVVPRHLHLKMRDSHDRPVPSHGVGVSARSRHTHSRPAGLRCAYRRRSLFPFIDGRHHGYC